jgi:hypothetical protein
LTFSKRENVMIGSAGPDGSGGDDSAAMRLSIGSKKLEPDK